MGHVDAVLVMGCNGDCVVLVGGKVGGGVYK